MEKSQLYAMLKENLTEHRYRHTLGMAQQARDLALRFEADPNKAEIAGLLHDYCKNWSADRLREVIVSHNLPQNLLQFEKEIWHAPVGAEVIRKEFGIEDEEILNAVRYHTTGRAGMSRLEKVICLADFIEPNRDFPGVEEIRNRLDGGLDKSLAYAIGSTIQYLILQEKKVYPLTLEAWNDLIG